MQYVDLDVIIEAVCEFPQAESNGIAECVNLHLISICLCTFHELYGVGLGLTDRARFARTLVSSLLLYHSNLPEAISLDFCHFLLLVSADFHIPLFHKVYAGNVNDSTEFCSITEELSTHYRQLAESCDHITLVFDKGNNSAQAFETVDASAFHFVGSLVPAQHADLLEVPLEKYEPLPGERLRDCRACRTRKTIFGQQRTKLSLLDFNIAHGFEHYGNLVTYMRLKGIVPPSSEAQK